jgi:hypothetical protein
MALHVCVVVRYWWGVGVCNCAHCRTFYAMLELGCLCESVIIRGFWPPRSPDVAACDFFL